MVKFPKFAEYAQILKNSVASEGDLPREDISDEGPGGSGWKALVVECRLLIMLCYMHYMACLRIRLNTSRNIHVPTRSVAQWILYKHYDPAKTLLAY